MPVFSPVSGAVARPSGRRSGCGPWGSVSPSAAFDASGWDGAEDPVGRLACAWVAFGVVPAGGANDALLAFPPSCADCDVAGFGAATPALRDDDLPATEDEGCRPMRRDRGSGCSRRSCISAARSPSIVCTGTWRGVLASDCMLPRYRVLKLELRTHPMVAVGDTAAHALCPCGEPCWATLLKATSMQLAGRQSLRT